MINRKFLIVMFIPNFMFQIHMLVKIYKILYPVQFINPEVREAEKRMEKFRRMAQNSEIFSLSLKKLSKELWKTSQIYSAN
ncbi:hypothetical protein TNCT_670761 [Trichonephila clavata]|uniref:Uncharacterized protein n=1 Tax=Trichonephila clavata TaxID=2740835 RepID=A0A8X6HUM6_TRICU|nr:hypothetical protein TNCT_670761 [Trichonephila clavata]